MQKPKVYLAGQSNEYENNWKEKLTGKLHTINN